MSEPIVRFVAVCKTYDGRTRVVDGLDLDIERGEFLTLLGPSGSGKTTTLMMLAGFETPTEGEILLDGNPLSRLPPYRRAIGMQAARNEMIRHAGTQFDPDVVEALLTVIDEEGVPESVGQASWQGVTNAAEPAAEPAADQALAS